MTDRFTVPQFRALTAIPSNLLAALSRKIFARARKTSFSFSRCVRRDKNFLRGTPLRFRGQVYATRSYGAFWPRSCSDHVTIITCPGTGQKFGALEPRRCLEMSTVLLASRGQVELFGEQPTRGPTVSFLSLLLFFFLAFVSHPPPRCFLFPLFLFSRSVSVSLSIFLCSARSPSLGWFIRTMPQARQRRDQATKKDHLVLYILVPAAMILSTAFKNIPVTVLN